MTLPALFLLVASAISVATYLGAACLVTGEIGYPLDDSWIHQAVARNVALWGEWGINPGEPVAVSTSPLWTVLLVPGHLGGLPALWTYLLGWFCLALVGWETTALGRRLFPDRSSVALAAGLLVVFEWHLVWAAASGMETVLFAALALATLNAGLSGRPLAAGPLVALAAAVRPEGLLLGGLLIGRSLLLRRLGEAMGLAVTAALGVLPLLALNLATGGSPLPATFYAKHAAYGLGSSQAAFVAGAFVELARGPVLLLLPGVLMSLPGGAAAPGRSNLGWGRSCPMSLRGGEVWALVPLAWVAAMLVVYAAWLPVLYHHGRYLMPLLPVLVLYGMQGSRLLLDALPLLLFRRVAPGVLALMLAVSWLRGAQVYAENVGYVNGQHVALARWLAVHTPVDAIIGTHDIGAIAYFSDRRLVDIAGLATQELASAPRNVPRVMQVLEERRVSHVALLPDWYPLLYDAAQGAGHYREVPVNGLQTPPPGASAFVVLERVP